MSVDPETKKALRSLAVSLHYAGYLSGLLSLTWPRKRDAGCRPELTCGGARYVRSIGAGVVTVEANIEREVAVARRRRRGRRVA